MFDKVILSIRFFLCMVLAPLLFTGCFPQATPNDARPPTQRPHNKAAREIVVPVPRTEFVAAARNLDLLRRLRLVEVVASEEVGRSAFPEYRLFNVLPKSPYALLGLVDGDILVSANDYVLNDPERFRQYVQVLANEGGETFVELRRQGEEVILRFRFVS